MFYLNRFTTITHNVRSQDVRTVYYLLIALRDLAMGFVSATYALFLLSHGLTALQMNLVNTAFMTGNFVFEIPTGVYADFFGRKRSYMIHAALLALSGFIYFFSRSFPFFIIAELTAALAFTFASGAIDAWLVDNVSENWITRTDYIFSQAQVFSKVALIGGGILGAYLGQINLAYPWFLTGLTGLVTLFISWLYMKPDSQPTQIKFSIVSGLSQMQHIAVDSFKYGFSHPIIFWLIISTALSQFAFQPLNMFWAPRFNHLAGDKLELMGWLWAAMSLFMMVGNYLSKKLVTHHTPYWKVMLASSLLLSLPILVSSLSPILSLATGFFLIYEIGRGIDKPMKTSYINRYAPPGIRATLLSFDSMIGKLTSAFGLVLFGALADATSFAFTWVIAGMLLLLLIPVYLGIRNKEHVQPIIN